MKNSLFIIILFALISHAGSAYGDVSHTNVFSNSGGDVKPLKPFQMSILPMLGTDGTNTIDYRYRVSLNLFAGITGGVEGIELAYFMNINRGHVEGFQAAGFGNVARGDVAGFQAAGFGNVLHGNSQGFQGAGFMNVVHGDAFGVRGAGFMNVISGNKQGIQWGGFMNVVGGSNQGISAAGFGNFYRDDFAGISAAGFMNTFGGQAEGMHLAGFANAYNGVARGFMLAGFGNFAKELVQGAQLAGFMNTAGDIQGLQVAGFLNVARKVEGIQLGFINVSDTISGLPIGFLSITRKGGLRRFELGASDALITNISFNIGVPAFYNIFSIGHLPLHDELRWATGYGIGTNIDLAEDRRLQIELHSYQMHRANDWWDNEFDHRLNEARTLFAFRSNSNFKFFAGPVIYWQQIKKHDDLLADDLSLAPYTIFERDGDTYDSRWWAGVRAGIRWVWR